MTEHLSVKSILSSCKPDDAAESATLNLPLGRVYRELGLLDDPSTRPTPFELINCARILDRSTGSRQLVAFLFRLVAYKAVPLELGQAEAEDIAAHTALAIGSIAELGPSQVSMFVEEFAALMIKLGAAESALSLVDEFLRRVSNLRRTDADAAVGLFGALVAKYDLLLELGRWRQIVRANPRRDQLSKLLEFLDEELSPALDAATVAMAGYPLMQDHHRMTKLRRMDLENRLALASGKPPPWRLADWKVLSSEFREGGDSVNADRATIAGLQNFLLVARDRDLTRRGVQETIREMIDSLDNLVCEDKVDSWPIRQTVAALLAAIGAWDEVRSTLETVRSEVEIAVAACADEVTKSRVLSTANDWLGLALRLDLHHHGCTSSTFLDLYRLCRERDFRVPVEIGTSTLVVLAFRTGAAMGVVSESGENWARHRSGEPLVQALDRLHSLGQLELEAHLAGKKERPAADWFDALKQLRARMGVPDGRLKTARRMVWSEDSRLPTHSLWTSESGTTNLGLLQTSAGETRRTPTASDPVVFVDGFATGEPLSKLMRRICRRVGGTLAPVASKAEFQAAVVQPCRLIVVGCHGVQSTVLGGLSIELGGKLHRVDALLKDHHLATEAQVLCFTCFGSGGALNALMEQGSLTHEFLRAGALAVTASCWPAWFYPTRPDDFDSVILGLSKSALAADPWLGAEAVSNKVSAWRKTRSPKWWAGWSTWVADGARPASNLEGN